MVSASNRNEITARFKDSQNHFVGGNTYVALLAWLPDSVVFGKPQILGACVVPGGSVAEARDTHYHNPPDYLVLEPGDTTLRTRNLQQTNTNGYKWQGTIKEFQEAEQIVAQWGAGGEQYKPTPEYQLLLRQLIARFNYRLDTNFAKIDRIVHPEIERFKSQVYGMPFNGLTIGEWNRVLSSKQDAVIERALARYLDIKEVDADELLQ